MTMADPHNGRFKDIVLNEPKSLQEVLELFLKHVRTVHEDNKRLHVELDNKHPKLKYILLNKIEGFTLNHFESVGLIALIAFVLITIVASLVHVIGHTGDHEFYYLDATTHHLEQIEGIQVKERPCVSIWQAVRYASDIEAIRCIENFNVAVATMERLEHLQESQ